MHANVDIHVSRCSGRTQTHVNACRHTQTQTPMQTQTHACRHSWTLLDEHRVNCVQCLGGRNLQMLDICSRTFGMYYTHSQWELSVYWLELQWYFAVSNCCCCSIDMECWWWPCKWLGLRLVVWLLHGNHSTGQRKCQRRYLMFRPRSENRKVRPVPDRLVILVTSSNL